MNRLSRVILAAVMLLPFGSCERPAATGVIRVALSEDECDDYCLAALRATLYPEGEDLPLGPALQVGCGEELSFSELPAGERVVVALQAFDITGEILLEGRSAALTIVAGAEAEARVPLTALAPPELVSATPDPVVVGEEGASVTLGGTFGDALGRSDVELGGASYSGDLAVFSDESVALTLAAGARGDEVVVRRCGVASDPLPLRIIGPTAGEAAASGGPACQGLSARAVAFVAGDALIAWACGDGSGALMRMSLDDALCPLDPGASWALDAAPSALAVRATSAYVATAGGLVEVDLSAPGAAPERLTQDATVSALAATTSEVYGLVGGQLRHWRLGAFTEVAGVDAELTLTALAASPEAVFVAAHNAAGEGRLVSLSAAGVVASYSLADAASRCREPTAIAVSADARAVATSCAGGGVAVWNVASQTLAFIAGDEAQALAFDDPSDVLFGLGADTLMVNDLDRGEVIHAFARGALPAGRPALLALASRHRLLMPTSAAPLAVLTPFDGAGLCP